jgi:hypothetical protein
MDSIIVAKVTEDYRTAINNDKDYLDKAKN